MFWSTCILTIINMHISGFDTNKTVEPVYFPLIFMIIKGFDSFWSVFILICVLRFHLQAGIQFRTEVNIFSSVQPFPHFKYTDDIIGSDFEIKCNPDTMWDWEQTAENKTLVQ